MDCIRTAPETARFVFYNPKPLSNSVSQSDEDGDQMDTLLFNQSYWSMDTFRNAEGFCRGAYYRDTYFYVYLLPGNTYY